MALNVKQLIALKQIPNCGNKSIMKIADYLLHEDVSDIRDLLDGINECIEQKIVSRIKENVSREELERYIDRADKLLEKSEEMGIKAITYLDIDFPKILLDTVDEKGKSDIPIILYYKGDLDACKLPGIAIIGTREPTKEGIMAGEYFGKTFADAGYNIVSGLAVGCDTAGHRGALTSQHGITTSFLAHGLDMVYPPENTDLAEEIVEKGGLLMSEYPIGTKVNRFNLVARDRLQAALSLATIVIQTGLKGGTMHASNTTLISGKPLFCVEYNNISDMSKIAGNFSLVSKGAHFISSKTAMTMVEEAIRKSKDIQVSQNTLF